MVDTNHSPEIRLPGWFILAVAAVFIAGALLLYWKILSVPFLFDDIYIIYRNPIILSFGRLADMLHNNRPLVQISYAVNWALGGDAPVPYRLWQVVLHALNAFLLFMVTARLLKLFDGDRQEDGCGIFVAYLAGAVFTAHPLLSMSVVMVSARSELWCAFFYLLGLLLFLRQMERESRFGWIGVSLVYLAGSISKEVIVTFPAACLLLQWLNGENPWAALRRQWKLYAMMAAVSAGIVIKFLGFDWRGTVGGDALPFTRWEYLLTQVTILARYLKIFVLPLPGWLSGDWDYPVVRGIADSRLLISAAVWAVLGFGLWKLWRARRLVPFWAGVMAIVACLPTSSVIPIADPLLEYRIYLPAVFLSLGLASLLALLADRLARRFRDFAAEESVPLSEEELFGNGTANLDRKPFFARLTAWTQRPHGWMAVAGISFLVMLCLFLNIRLEVYRSPESFWQDAIRKSPNKSRPRYNLAHAFFLAGKLESARMECEQLLRRDSKNADAWSLAGDIRRERGEEPAALQCYRRALEIDPKSSDVANKVCYLLIRHGHYGEAFDILSRFTDAQKGEGYFLNFAVYFSRTGQLDRSAALYRQILADNPFSAVVWTDLGNLYQRMSRFPEAESCYSRALALQPNYYLALHELGVLSLARRDPAAALEYLERARAANPWFAWTRYELGNACAMKRDYAEAQKYFEDFLKQRPEEAEAWFRLGLVRRELRLPQAAASCFARALQIDPRHPGARAALSGNR